LLSKLEKFTRFSLIALTHLYVEKHEKTASAQIKDFIDSNAFEEKPWLFQGFKKV